MVRVERHHAGAGDGAALRGVGDVVARAVQVDLAFEFSSRSAVSAVRSHAATPTVGTPAPLSAPPITPATPSAAPPVITHAFVRFAAATSPRASASHSWSVLPSATPAGGAR